MIVADCANGVDVGAIVGADGCVLWWEGLAGEVQVSIIFCEAMRGASERDAEYCSLRWVSPLALVLHRLEYPVPLRYFVIARKDRHVFRHYLAKLEY